jgi:hypothetical protein
MLTSSVIVFVIQTSPVVGESGKPGSLGQYIVIAWYAVYPQFVTPAAL